MTGIAAAVVEAWQELRIHRLRVLLSLIGVGVAVCALTSAVAVSSIAKQALVEQAEREGGRPTTFGIFAYSESGEPAPSAETRRVFDETMRDFGITFHSAIGESEAMAVLPKGPRRVTLRAVDVPYADLRRMVPLQGRWLTKEDAQNLSPAVVVDARMLKALGLGPDSLPATVTFSGESSITATIVGQVRKDEQSGGPTAYILFDAYDRWFGANQQMFDVNFQMWVPPSGSKALGKAVGKELRSELPGMQLEVARQDYDRGESFKTFKYVVGGISALILLLGAMSLLNIALVTIKQRVREIGIRRSFGATTSRVFFSVMMESVVATFVAGLVGVVGAVGIVNSPLIADHVITNVTDIPPFPISAAILGLVVSLAVGSLAGLLPAVIAVRVKIIDAIRF
ncbi:MAG: putative transport system permease protein [Nocardioidaceae bacterium]|nr:putative transport system permease protein [Nocardioidaceae bacterium]